MWNCAPATLQLGPYDLAHLQHTASNVCIASSSPGVLHNLHCHPSTHSPSHLAVSSLLALSLYQRQPCRCLCNKPLSCACSTQLKAQRMPWRSAGHALSHAQTSCCSSVCISCRAPITMGPSSTQFLRVRGCVSSKCVTCGALPCMCRHRWARCLTCCKPSRLPRPLMCTKLPLRPKASTCPPPVLARLSLQRCVHGTRCVAQGVVIRAPNVPATGVVCDAGLRAWWPAPSAVVPCSRTCLCACGGSWLHVRAQQVRRRCSRGKCGAFRLIAGHPSIHMSLGLPVVIGRQAFCCFP